MWAQHFCMRAAALGQAATGHTKSRQEPPWTVKMQLGRRQNLIFADCWYLLYCWSKASLSIDIMTAMYKETALWRHPDGIRTAFSMTRCNRMQRSVVLCAHCVRLKQISVQYSFILTTACICGLKGDTERASAYLNQLIAPRKPCQSFLSFLAKSRYRAKFHWNPSTRFWHILSAQLHTGSPNISKKVGEIMTLNK